MNKIGITERGDAALNLKWVYWVSQDKPAILISKNPGMLLDVLKGTFKKKPNVIVHCTITGLGGSRIEPNVPRPPEAIRGYHKMVKQFGKDRVVLRIDPIIPTPKRIRLAKKVLRECRDTRVRISFMDNYPHVQERFKSNNIKPLQYLFHAPLKQQHEIWEEFGNPEVCGEPSLPSSGCVSEFDCEVLGVTPKVSDKTGYKRLACSCLANKKELLDHKGQCKHGCLYCYWK